MPRTTLTGSRIRERRLMLQLRQAELARQIGISASYLNLIEHNRRRIGGKLLGDIALALGVDYTALSEGADRVLRDTLETLGRGGGLDDGAVEQIDGLIGRFPAWAELIRDQGARIAALEHSVDGLNDRLAHDPALSAAMHEVLSMVTAVRSTASILAGTPEIDANWLGRFHKNLDEDSRRLALGAEAMVDYFDAQDGRETAQATPLEAQAALWDAAGHHFERIEVEGAEAIDAILDGFDTQVPGTLSIMRHRLGILARDAAALPLDSFLPEAQAAGFDPARLMQVPGRDLSQVLRRLACLPDGAEVPDRGLVVCDGAGAMLHRKAMPGLSLPFLGAACPLLILFDALQAPLHPQRALLEMPDGARFRAWAVAAPEQAPGFEERPPIYATMLLIRADDAQDESARPVGPNCRVCARAKCAARREPSMIGPRVA